MDDPTTGKLIEQALLAPVIVDRIVEHMILRNA